MILKLDDKKIVIQKAKKREYSKEYHVLREKIWKEEKQKYQNNIWNGELYTVEEIKNSDSNGQLVLSLGLCEYKDIVLKNKIGIKKLYASFGSKMIPKHLFITVIPKTTNNKYLFVKIGSATYQNEGVLDLIGGSLNHDEQKIESLEDIKKAAVSELKEEAEINVNIDSLKGFVIIRYNASYHFVFSLNTSVDANGLRAKKDSHEISKVVELSKKEIKNYKDSSTKEFEFCKKYIEELYEKTHKLI